MRVDVYHQLRRCLDADRLAALATVIAGPGRGRQLLIAPAAGDQSAVKLGGLGSEELEAEVLERAQELLASFQSRRLSFATDDGEVDVFIEVHPPRPKLIIVGAVHVAAALVSFARTLGFRTVVVDPRTAFATPERFAHADELRTDWPDEALRHIGLDARTAVVTLTHDPKLDDPAIIETLGSDAFYLGCLGSTRTHAKRLDRLRAAGLTDEQLTRIHAPVGLNIGGKSPAEIAVSVMAQVTQVLRQG